MLGPDACRLRFGNDSLDFAKVIHLFLASGTIVYVSTMFQLRVSNSLFTFVGFWARRQAAVESTSTPTSNRKFSAEAPRTGFCPAGFDDFSRLFHRVLSINIMAR